MCAKCEVFDINPNVVGEFIGKPDAEYLASIGSCVFGCGSTVSDDGDGDGVGAGICPSCRDHSANEAVCEECGAAYEDWGGIWKLNRPAYV